MKNLFEMLQAIFGKNIISKTIGTRTNVIKLPTNKSSPLKNEFDVFKSAENPAVFEKLKKVIEDEAPYISRMNDAERLIYEGNVKRLHDYLVSIGEIKPTISAEVIGLGTKEPISGKGLESLVEEAGQTSPPGTLVGDIQSRINRLKNLAKEEGTTMQDVVGDFASGQKGMLKLRDEGLVRSTARQIMFNDIKSGKLKASKEVQDIVSGRASGDPIDSFRTIYGEDALEQLDSLTPDFRQLKTEVDAEKLARSKFEFTPKLDRPKESYTPEEMKKILKEGEEEGSKGLDYLTGQEPPEKKANGGRIGYAEGTPMAGLVYVGSWEGPWTGSEFLGGPRKGQYYNSSKNSLTAITGPDGAIPRPGMPITTIQSPQQSETISTPEIPLTLNQRYNKYLSAAGSETSDELYKSYRANLDKKADGGRIGFSKGKRVKSQIDKLLEQLNKKTQGKKSMETVNPKTGEVTVPKKPIRRAEEPTGMTTMDPEPEIVDEKSIPKPKKKITQRYNQDIIKAADEIYPSYDDPKIAADQIVDSYAQMKYGLEDQYGLSNKERMDLYTQAYDYVMDYNRGAIRKTAGESINISDPKTAEAFTNFARENDPEGFKKIQKIVDDINNKNALEEFDIKNREPNANGGIAGLL